MRWQDILLLVLRAFGVAGFTLAVYWLRTQDNLIEEVQTTDLLLFAGLSGALVLGSAALAAIKNTRGLAPFVQMLTDWVIIGGVAYLSDANPTLMVGIVAFLVLTFAGTDDAMLSGFYAIVALAVAYAVILYQFSGQDLSESVDLQAMIDVYGVPMLALAIIVIGTIVWNYAEGRFGSQQQARLRKIAKEREEQLERMRERAHAITEMTTRLTGTLNYERILEAALDIGDLSLRADVGDQRVISVVLLFRSDNRLYIADGRGLNQELIGQNVRSDAGILAKTLEESIPTINANIANDAILGHLPGFRQMRSLLCVPMRAHYDNFGLLLYGTTAADAFDPDHIDILQAIGVQATVALQNSVLYGNLLREKTRIIQMEEDARKALVRDLHDVPTQTISGVAMRLRILLRLFEKSPEQIPSEIEQIEKMALRATEEIRHVLFKLRPLALENQGLVAALDQLAEKMQKTYRQAVTVRITEDVEKALDETQKGALFYLIEEAVNNARKYAEAPMIMVQGKRQADAIVLQISDNGKGFDADAVNANYGDRGSFGMVNMRERAELLNGSLQLKSVPGKGTTVQVMIPLESVRKQQSTREYAQMNMSKLAVSARRNLNREQI